MLPLIARRLADSDSAQQDISDIRIKNLQSKAYIDKTQNATSHTENSSAVSITGETDRVYQGLDPLTPIIVTDDDKPLFAITRETMTDATVWNPWIEKSKGMSDLPDDAYKKLICVEPGSVSGWQALEAGDSWEGGQTIKPRI